MNRIEGQSNRYNEIKNNISKRIGATILATVLATGGVGSVGENKASAEGNNVDTRVETLGELSGQTEAEKSVNLAQVRDKIFSKSRDTQLSVEDISVAKQAFEEWKETTFTPYENRLREIEGVKEERVPFCARVLYCIEKSRNPSDDRVRFQNYLKQEEVVDYAKGNKNSDVVCDKDGVPRVWFVVAEKEIAKKARKGFDEAIKWYKNNGALDIIESNSENGLCVFFVANTHPDKNSDSVWLNEWGVVCSNQGYENTKKLKDNGWRNHFIFDLYVEPYGIKFHQVSKSLGLFDDFSSELGNMEVNKSLVAGYVGEALSGKDKDGIYEVFAENYPVAAVKFAKDYAFCGVSSRGVLTKQLLELMSNFLRIPGFDSLKSVPPYNEAMAKW